MHLFCVEEEKKGLPPPLREASCDILHYSRPSLKKKRKRKEEEEETVSLAAQSLI